MSMRCRCDWFSIYSGAISLCIAANVFAADAPVIPLPQIPERTFSITDYGAVADGKTLNTEAINQAIAACDKAGGGVIRIPAGKFVTAVFALGNNMNLHLEKDAVLLLSDRFADYKTDEKGNYHNLITATGCHDVAITGEGVIDGQGKAWWDEFSRGKEGYEPKLGHRPFLVVIKDCSRVLVRGVTLRNSPMFHLVPQGCTDVTIDRITIHAPSSAPNTDGIDPSGWNFSITNCIIDTGDDNIAIKAGGKPRTDGKPSCENFYIANCIFKAGHGMSIGGQTSAGLRGLVVRNCTFEGTGAGIRMKANRGSGGLVENCLYENITMKNVKHPIYINSYYPERGTPKSAAADAGQPVDATTPIWRNITIRNLVATDCPNAGRIIGLPEMAISDVLLENISISAQRGLMLWNVSGVQFKNAQISLTGGPALDVQNGRNITGFTP